MIDVNNIPFQRTSVVLIWYQKTIRSMAKNNSTMPPPPWLADQSSLSCHLLIQSLTYPFQLLPLSITFTQPITLFSINLPPQLICFKKTQLVSFLRGKNLSKYIDRTHPCLTSYIPTHDNRSVVANHAAQTWA